MVKTGHASVWDGPLSRCPWWWPHIFQVETRIDSLKETAAYDPDHKPPPRDLWPMSKSDELELYLEERRKENERRMRDESEKRRVLDDYPR